MIFKDVKTFIKKENGLLCLLILTDLIFVFIHTLYLYGITDDNSNYSLEKDFGYSEVFQYIKEYWIFLLLLFIFIRKKKITYFIWSVFFLYLLLDDSLSIHENYGELLANYFNITPQFNLRSVDFGEILVSLSVGVSFLILLLLAYIKGGIREREITRTLALFIIMLAFFGVFVDLIHVALPIQKNKIAVIEDGGEMLVMSIILSYVFMNYSHLKLYLQK
ncbi:hypothetical protein Q4Q39_11065 [Flavivirga amylovorans]|uniref:DUF4386 family protein n=1 Tax=Flavivirga amylovorans TaxID=870486 RepID=A0ABT8X1W9_9FLAO|nr:hypothetical protein [Flavivirga amylovorans]MDO5987943.1 hypothetical protein [Flavivirga amylovorans]